MKKMKNEIMFEQEPSPDYWSPWLEDLFDPQFVNWCENHDEVWDTQELVVKRKAKV
jgi:hypothetical protein